MTKRAAGTGTVRTLRPGRYQALGPSEPDPRRPGKRIRPSLYVGPDRARAEAYAAAGARHVDEARGQGVHLSGVTFRAWLERYLDAREGDKPRSIRAERAAAKHVLGPLGVAPWADDPIDTIRTPEIDDYLVALARRLPGMAKSAKAMLSGAFRKAARKGLVIGNPVSEVELPEVVRTHEPWTWLTLEEQAALLVAPELEMDRLLVTVWLYAGLRIGEILSLRIADVHLDRAEIVVRHGSLHGPPKGRKILPVHLFPVALAALRRALALLPAWLDGHPNRHGLAFPGPRGGQRPPSEPFRYSAGGWERILERAGILRRVGDQLSAAHRHDGQVPSSHDAFRHSCGAALASGMWGEPWTPQEIQRHLRHSALSETERYMHLAPNVLRDRAAAVRGVTHGMEHGPRKIRGKNRQGAPLFAVTSGYPDRAVPAEDHAIHAPSVTHQAAEALVVVDAALDAVARKDPHAGRQAVKALGVARAALDAVVAEAEPAEPVIQPLGRGKR